MAGNVQYVDSHGASVVGFAFTELLNFRLLSRLKNTGSIRLYRPERPVMLPMGEEPFDVQNLRCQHDRRDESLGAPVSNRGGGAVHCAGAEPIALLLLDEFELRRGDSVVPVGPSGQRLMAFLALQSRPVPRGLASGVLWPDASASRGGANLRTALWRLPAPEGRPLVAVTATHLSLAPAIAVDLHEGVAWADEMLDRHSAPCPSLSEKGARIVLRGDLLPHWDEEWLPSERERFRQLRLHALERLCERLTAEGRYGQALEAGLAAVDIEPLRESGHRAVLRVHVREGNAVEALRTYSAYEYLLAAELGLRPSTAMRRLIEPVLAARAGSGPEPGSSPDRPEPLDVPGARLLDLRLEDAWS
ncbi:AfsR/SARP family transcriptional regulator [Streptomyces rubrogriseus]|uniref:AfsR/SARP family transcriptional regulator n=1 Tax=Streptomyces rubrogriseus TaxID=194673 RepID=UPI0037ABA91D